MPKRIRLTLLQSLIALLLVALVIGVCYAKFPVYLSNYRVIQGVMPYQQNYVVLDDQIMSNTRHDLGDLRVFAELQEVPFELVTERGDNSLGHTEAKILSKVRVGSETEFVLDITGLPQCDQVDLSLADSARDFVSEAQVEGLRSPTERVGVNLGSSVCSTFRTRVSDWLHGQIRDDARSLPSRAPDEASARSGAASRCGEQQARQSELDRTW